MRRISQQLLGYAAALACLIAAPAVAGAVIEVSTPAQLSAAIFSVPDGGVIQLASGTYAAPAGGFQITDPGKSFTIRAASPGSAFLDGGGLTRVLQYRVSNTLLQGWVTFEGLVFQNGYSNVSTEAGGVTVKQGRVTFIDCELAQNSSAPVPQQGGVGGGVGVYSGSYAVFIRCTWTANTSSTQGGAGVISGDSFAFIHDSAFYDNRTNLAGHLSNSSGGGLTIWASTVRITNTRFEGNEAGFMGGAINVKGPWDGTESDVVVANCTFIDNLSEPYPTITTPSPAVGGAIHLEDAARVEVSSSRFLTNTARFGGAISLYRGVLEVDDSVFRGNAATTDGTTGGRGGSIQADSSDTTIDGNLNRRPSSITIRRSFIQGRYGSVGATAQVGGCIYATGDTNRMYGNSGVSQMGTYADNRVQLVVEGSALVDCDTTEQVSGTSFGGGIYGGLMAATISDSLIMDCDATGTIGWGGGGCFITESSVQASTSMLVNNTADVRGGGLCVSGSTTAVTGCTFIHNEVSPGVSEPENQSYGAALFITVQQQSGYDATGLVQGSTFINDVGIPVYDDDRLDAGGVYNYTQYNGNTFYNSSFAGRVFLNPVTGSTAHTATELNDLLVDRGNGNTTNKSPSGTNAAAGSEPVWTMLLGVPPHIIERTALDDPESATPAFLAYGWSGGPATLDGSPVSGEAGFASADVGTHTLEVGAQSDQAVITSATVPEAGLMADPLAISSGQSSQLEWSTTGDSFVDSMIDWGVDTQGASVGTASVTPAQTRTYRLLVTTREGGDLAEATVWVDEPPPSTIFINGFEEGGTGAWSTSVP